MSFYIYTPVSPAEIENLRPTRSPLVLIPPDADGNMIVTDHVSQAIFHKIQNNLFGRSSFALLAPYCNLQSRTPIVPRELVLKPRKQ
jgi:hypothetical protein